MKTFKEFISINESQQHAEKNLKGHEILAHHTDHEGYTVTTTKNKHVGKPFEVQMGTFQKTGRHYITSPKGKTVKAAHWSNCPEPEWKIKRHDWDKKPIKERAAMEAKQQATKYDTLKNQHAFHAKNTKQHKMTPEDQHED